MWRDPFDIQLGGPVVAREDLVPADRASQGTGFLENLNATRQEMLLVGNTDAGTNRLRGDYAPLVRALDEAGETFGEVALGGGRGRAHFLNPFDLPEQPGLGGVASRDQMRRAIFDRIRQRRQADPKFLPGVPDTFEEYEAASRAKGAAELQRIRQVQSGATGLGQIGGFLGGVAGTFQDPVNIWTMPFGGASKTIFGQFARSALENVVVETFSQPFITGNYADLGEEMGLSDSVRNVLFAGGAGGAFGATTKAIGKGFQAAGPAYDAFTAKVFEAMPEPIRQRWAKAAEVDDRLLADTIRATVPEERWTREQRDAVNVIEREAELREASPFMAGPDGDQAHSDSLAAALQAMVDAAPRPASRASLMSSAATPAPAVRAAVASGGRAAFMARVRGVESGGDDLARNPRSSAAGRYQFTDDTWARYHRRIYGGDGLADKADPAKQERLMAALTDDNEAALRAFGIPLTPGNYYLAHFAGSAGAAKLHRAAPGAPVADVLGARVVSANPFLEGKTAADAIAWAERKMGGEPGPGSTAGLARASGDDGLAADLAAELGDAEMRLAQRDAAGALDEAVAARQATPVLRRELFASDDDWVDAQVRLAQSVDDPLAGIVGRETQPDAPPGRETAAGPAEGAAGARRAADAAPDELTVQSYVDAYMRGEGRGNSPRDRELQQFAANEGPAIEAEFARRADLSRPLSIAELEDMMPDGRGPDGKRDTLWLAAHYYAEPPPVSGKRAPLWALRDKASGELATWTVNKRAAERELGKQWEPDNFSVEKLTAEQATLELRARAEREAGQAQVRLGGEGLDRFAEPDGEGARAQVESLEHDLRAAIEADPEFGKRRFTTPENDAPRTLLTILEDLDAEDAAVAAMKACL